MNTSKNLIKNLVLLLFLGFTAIVNAQFSGKVQSVLNLGSIDYAYIFVDEQGYYKTAAYEAGLLSIGDGVEIQPGELPNTNYRSFIKTSNTSIGVFAVKIQTENFTLPSSSIYGMPTVENEMLWFSSQEHFEEFYNIITDFSHSPYEFSEDLLKVVEKQFQNFMSFNGRLRKTFDFEEGLTDDELERLINTDYFKDEILKTLVNQYGEIGIAQEVNIMYMASDGQQCVTLVTNKRNINAVKSLRGVKKDEDFVLHSPTWCEFEIKKDGKKPTYVTKDLYSVNAVGDMWADISYTSRIQLDPVECSLTKVNMKFIVDRVTLNDAHEFINPNLFEGTVTVNWGDGTTTTMDVPPIPVTIDPSGTATYHQTELFLTHEYASEGDYSISTSGVFTSEFVLNPTEFTLSDQEDWGSPSVACTDNSYGDNETHIFSSDHKVVSEVWIKNFGVAHTIGAKITNYEKKNGKWKKRQENLSAEVYGEFRNDDCVYKEYKTEIDSGHERDIQAVKAKWWTNWSVANEDCWGELKAEHYGSVYTKKFIFNPCQ